MSTNRHPKNYDSVIHNESFEEEFSRSLVTHASMIQDGGREAESLNGYWHFALDQYDMSLRSKWYLERSKDDNGRDLPLDY